MSAPLRRNRADMVRGTTENLISVARTAFAEQGFSAVSLDAVASEAGVTRGALHHHFTNKAGLFEAVFRQVDAELTAEVTAVADQFAEHWAGFRAAFHAYLDLAQQPHRRRILFQDGPAVLGAKAYDIIIDSGLADIIATLRNLVDSGRITAPDPVALAHLVNGGTVTLAFWVAEAKPGEDRATPAHATLSRMFDAFGPA